jgi:hypothetical protein
LKVINLRKRKVWFPKSNREKTEKLVLYVVRFRTILENQENVLRDYTCFKLEVPNPV